MHLVSRMVAAYEQPSFMLTLTRQAASIATNWFAELSDCFHAIHTSIRRKKAVTSVELDVPHFPVHIVATPPPPICCDLGG